MRRLNISRAIAVFPHILRPTIKGNSIIDLHTEGLADWLNSALFRINLGITRKEPYTLKDLFSKNDKS